ncbi:DsbA family protein [Ancylobacter pratisalsi]|uniref:DsbA family protein n=1 Tax=Ancylobacter pratisalsi TaxID=1745854 RepID=A0A6P1YGS5_9HYPH|nr:DsbA family protein [Ancylobacter pratisalsi]QIB32479.1 DsbA family protein [Ancylobacter pratisalsi]
MPTPTFLRRAGRSAIAACLLLGVGLAPAAALDDTQRKEFEGVIREYLLKNPEVIQEAIMELQKRQAAAEANQRNEALTAMKPLVFDSPRGTVVGNPDGDVTLVEFFDYNCGYCKRALADLVKLTQDDPKLKVVLKEFPVLGPGSVEAAQVAVAVRLTAPDKYFAFHQKLLGERGQANREKALAAAKEVGIDKAALEKAMSDPEVNATLQESLKIADALGIDGTPSYVTGDAVIVGAVGHDQLKSAIDSVRACGKTQC